ncbi:MAG: GyrI-like domain-containing protein [Chloroflexota bacterium]|nr:GyrI-like domain-containing protein [Chloroflexota bacterium]
MTQNVELKRAEAQHVIAMRDILSDYRDVETLFDEVESFLAGQGIEAAGPRIILFYDTLEDRDIEASAAIPIAEPLPERPPVDEPLMLDTLPAADTLACLRHEGGYDTLGESYDVLREWAAEHGYWEVGPRRVVERDGKMEMQLPVEKR